MAYFKITNITDGLGKRHPRFNTVQNIEFRTGNKKESVTVLPGAEILMESSHLPMGAHKLRSEGLITVVEIDKNTFMRMTQVQKAPEVVVTDAEPAKVSDADNKNKRFRPKS